MFELDTEYYLWGAGTYGTRLIDFMKNELTFKAVIDNSPEKQGTYFHGVSVIGYQEAKTEMPVIKVVIAQVYPNVVRNFLLSEGYGEYVDFVSIYDFVPRYFWERKAQLVPKVVNFAPSNFCNLNCAYCQSYMYLAKQPRITPIEEMIRDIDLLFRHIDSIFLINLCLGESFLNKELTAFVRHAHKEYAKRYGTLVILTNGTIVPPDVDLLAFAETDVVLSVSDYSDSSPKVQKTLTQLIEKCEQIGVKYYLNTSSNQDAWFDFGNPLVETETRPEKLRQRYSKCFKPGNGVRDGKLFLCQLHNAAVATANVSQPEEGDYFNLQQPKSRQSQYELLKIITRVPDRGHVEHCKRCNGSLLISEVDKK